MTNNWIPHDGWANPVREGETLVAVRFRNGKEQNGDGRNWDWGDTGGTFDITHYQVSPPCVTQPATMSADEVLIRAREAAIAAMPKTYTDWAYKTRNARHDSIAAIQSILAYERDRAKPLAEVAPHTAEDPDERAAYGMCRARQGQIFTWEEREGSTMYRGFLAGIKRGRELERGA